MKCASTIDYLQEEDIGMFRKYMSKRNYFSLLFQRGKSYREMGINVIWYSNIKLVYAQDDTTYDQQF